MPTKYGTVLIEGLLLGVAAGNIWSAPFIGGDSIVGLGLVSICLFFSARLHIGWRFGRTAVVATLAWPVAFGWQAIHQSVPAPAVGLLQACVLVVGSQFAALLAGWLQSRAR